MAGEPRPVRCLKVLPTPPSWVSALGPWRSLDRSSLVCAELQVPVELMCFLNQGGKPELEGMRGTVSHLAPHAQSLEQAGTR